MAAAPLGRGRETDEKLDTSGKKGVLKSLNVSSMSWANIVIIKLLIDDYFAVASGCSTC